MVKSTHPLPRTQRCKLLGLSRSTSYYQPKPVSQVDQALMKLIDRIHTAKPFLGSRRVVDALRDQGHHVNRKRVCRLMKRMGIHAIHPGPKTSQPHPQHKVYPYLLRNLRIDRANQVWASDVTYIPMATGFIYLTVIMDWYSRKVLSWRLSNSLEGSFCVEALEEAIFRYGAPEIVNTDQGCQYTSESFTRVLKDHDIDISMDGKGAWRDNVMVERLWRSIKYEEIYLNAYESVKQAKNGIGRWIEFYNRERKHQTLGMTPDLMYGQPPSLRQAA